MSTRSSEMWCGYIGRISVLILASVGVALSIVASMNCDFLYFENDRGIPWEGLTAPFEGVTKAKVGIFSYQIIEAINNTELETDSCVSYDSNFASSEYEVLVAAQFCGAFAPLLALLAIITNLFETCICSFFLSFLITSALFLAACGVQAGTFSLFAEPDICYEWGQSCDVGVSVYLSGAAMVVFWCACVLLCCFPRPDPVCAPKPRQPSRRESGQPQAIIQPVVINNSDYDYEEEYGEAPPPSPRRKSSKIQANEPEAPRRKSSKREGDDSVSGVHLDDKITEEDFDTPDLQEGTTRVEVKEKSFPDGTRQVDAITHYADGSKSVKTQTYKD